MMVMMVIYQKSLFVFEALDRGNRYSNIAKHYVILSKTGVFVVHFCCKWYNLSQFDVVGSELIVIG